MIKNYLLLLALCFFSSLNAQTISITDANFKTKLLQASTSNQIALNSNGISIKIDTNDNKEIEISEAANVGYLNLTNSQLSSLEGISSFSNLKSLQCGSNSLKNLNVTSLSKLETLRCDRNLLTSLEISGLSELIALYCDGNQLTDLNVNGVSKLQAINCEYNKLTEMDLTSLKELYYLICGSNNLTSLKLSGLSKLNNIDCQFNTLSTFEIKNLPALQRLNCKVSFSTATVDLSGVPNLTWLDCSSNKFTSLDLSNLTKLKYLDCGFNKLTALDASNLKSLTSLLCWRNELTSLNVNGLTLLESLNCSENKFTSFTGTGLSKIKSLDVRGNKLTSLDVSSSTSLESLFCSENLLTSLNFSGLNNLKMLYCNNNKLTNIDVTGLSKLTYFYCKNNILTSINVKNLINLTELYIDTNQLTNIDLTGLDNLNIFSCSVNKFTDINIFGLKNLTAFYCTTNELNKIDVTGLSKLSILACGKNKLTNLDLTGLNNLIFLNCNYNQFSSLNVSGLTSLKDFYCTNNQIKDLDLSGLSNLGLLQCDNNLLTKLNVSGLKKLQILSFKNNTIDSIDLTGLQNIITFDCSNNKLSNLDFSTVIYTPQESYMGPGFFIYEYADGSAMFTDRCDYNLNGNQFDFINLKNSNKFEVEFSNNASLKYICVNDNKIGEIEESISKYGYTDCHVNSYCSFKPGGTNYIIQGNSRIDSNNNGCNALDIAASNIKFVINDTVKNESIINDATGSYFIPVSEGSYTVVPTLENPDYFTVSPSSVNVTFPSGLSPYNQDFCLSPNGAHKDLEISVLPVQPARPGFDAKYKIIYKNKGNVAQSGSVNFAFDDSTLDFVSSNTAISTQTTDNIVWNFSSLKPLETKEIEIVLKVNTPTQTPAVNNNDILRYTAKINSAETDEIEADNTFELNQTVVGSYDPNDKTCLEGNVIKPELIGQYVHYMIRFENTGNYPAENIVVKDIIDLTKFDISTLVPTKSSHSYTTKISNGNKVEFIFEKINLPFDDANNDGYIAFKIKTLPTLKVGDTFTNEANIYFDYNYPILTNKATSTFKTLGTQDFEFSSYFNVYPNPAKNDLNISSNDQIEIQSMSVYDILGQLVIAVPNAEKASKVDVSKLRTGSYILKIKTDKGISGTKFIKE